MFRRAQVVLGLAALVARGARCRRRRARARPAARPPGLDKAIAAKEKHAQRMLDKPGVVGIGVGLNPAGKPVIEIYKEKPDVADLPDELDGVPVESSRPAVIEAAALRPIASRDPYRSASRPGLAGVATGTLGARVTDGTNVYALSNNHVFAGVNTASIGDPIIQPGDVGRRKRPGRSHRHARDVPDDRLQRRHEHDGRRDRADVDGERRYRDAGRRLRSAEPRHGAGVHRAGRCRSTAARPGSSSATSPRRTCPSTSATSPLRLLPPGGAVRRTRSRSHPARSARPATPARSSSRRARTSRSALLFAGGDGLTIAHADRRRPPAVRRHDRRRAAGGRPARRPHRPLRARRRRQRLALVDGAEPSTEARRSRTTRCTAARARAARPSSRTPARRRAIVDTTAANGTTYYYKVSAENANGEGALSNEASATPTDLVAPDEPLADPRRLRPREREPALGRRALDERRQRLGSRPGSTSTSNSLACSKTTTCTAWRNAAQYGPDVEVWTRRLDAARRQQPRPPARAPAGCRHLDLRRLHAAHEPARRNRSDLLRAHRQRRLRQPPDGQPGARRRRRPAPARQGLDPRGLAQRELGVVATRRRHRLDLRRGRLRRESACAGRPDASTTSARAATSQNPPGAPTALSALAGDAQRLASRGRAPTFDGGSPVTDYRVYRGTSSGGETFLANAGDATSYVDTDRSERHDLLLQGVRA